MKSFLHKTCRRNSGFSLVEALSALVIGTMILVAILGIYRRAERSAAAITRRLDESRLAGEVLQLIAEDIDRTVTLGSDVQITAESKMDARGYSIGRLTILRTIYDKKDKKQTFEKIIWQGSYDYYGDTDSLILYRSHTGMGSEDKLLEEGREDWEQSYSFIPICCGVTFFRVQVPLKDALLDRWTRTSLPPGIIVTISFAEPFKTVEGTLDVLDEEKSIRTIVPDRTKKVQFTITKAEDKIGKLSSLLSEKKRSEEQAAEEKTGEDKKDQKAEEEEKKDDKTPQDQKNGSEGGLIRGHTIEELNKMSFEELWEIFKDEFE